MAESVKPIRIGPWALARRGSQVAAVTPSTTVRSTGPSEVEIEFWRSIKDTNKPEELNAYLLNPKAMVPGTNMNFAGIPRGTERADLLSFLNSKADNPAPLPKAADAATAPGQFAQR